MTHSTIELDADAIEALADIRMRLIAIAGPHLWPDLLIAIVDDYLATWDDLRPDRAHVPGWLESVRREKRP